MLPGIGAQPLHQEVLRFLKRALRPGASAIDITVAKAANVLGIGQTWQNLTASRAPATVYTNTLDRSIVVSAIVRNTVGSAAMTAHLYINGAITLGYQQAIASAAANSLYFTPSAIVPPGATYSLVVTNGTLDYWAELR